MTTRSDQGARPCATDSGGPRATPGGSPRRARHGPAAPGARVGAALGLAVLGLAVLALAVLAPPARADELVVYTKGRVIRYDPDVGRELQEAVLVTYDTEAKGSVKKEILEVYFHLSDDQEVITPAQITERCQQVFVIEKVETRFYYRGLRPAAPTPAPAPAPAPVPVPAPDPAPAAPVEPPAAPPEDPAAATPEPAEAAVEAAVVPPPPSREEIVLSVREKVHKVTDEILAIDSSKPDSAKLRTDLVNRELTTILRGFDDAELMEVAGFVTEKGLSPNREYYVLRSFGWAFHTQAEYEKAAFFYDRCIDRIPDNYSAHLQKGYAWEKAQRNDDAIRAYTEALRIQPERAIRYFWSLVRRLERTEQLAESDVAELRKEVEAVARAVRKEDEDAAATASERVHALVTRLYAPPAPGGEVPGAPETPPPGEPPATPEPFGAFED